MISLNSVLHGADLPVTHKVAGVAAAQDEESRYDFDQPPDDQLPGDSVLIPRSMSRADQQKMRTEDKQCQWEDPSLELHGYSKRLPVSSTLGVSTSNEKSSIADKSCQCEITDDTVLSTLIKTDADAKLYTGLKKEALFVLIDCMDPFRDQKLKLAVCDQILMTLMKLKLNLVLGDLSRRFSVSTGYASKIINFWIDTLSKHLTQLLVWLPRETIRSTMPACFERYPKTTGILDCAETLLQKPSNLKSRGESYSNYKSHNTVKYCVAIAPSGVIMFISKAYGGRASDKFIVRDCGILDRLFPGDEIMADRGFTIQDLLFPLQVKLNIPAFSQGKQLSEEEVTRTRRLANVRIHVERAIRRLKVFKILRDIIPVSMAKNIDKILRICAALHNLNSDLIKS